MSEYHPIFFGYQDNQDIKNQPSNYSAKGEKLGVKARGHLGHVNEMPDGMERSGSDCREVQVQVWTYCHQKHGEHLPSWELTCTPKQALLSRWFSFSRLVGYVIVPWRVQWREKTMTFHISRLRFKFHVVLWGKLFFFLFSKFCCSLRNPEKIWTYT